MQGYVDKIYENTSQNNRLYWNIIIDGEKYSTFSQSLVNQCSEGFQVDFEFRQNGNYRNLTAVNGVRDEGRGGGQRQGPPPPQRGQVPPPQQQGAPRPAPPPVQGQVHPLASEAEVLGKINETLAQGLKMLCEILAKDRCQCDSAEDPVETAKEVFPESKEVQDDDIPF
jgi:hypothetical protein